MSTSPAQGVRAAVKDGMRRQILDSARARLATDGAVGLSLRAVARDVGLVSSAVYRYFPSRDALLTELIIEAYDDLADAVEATEAPLPRGDLHARWVSLCAGAWRWGVARPNEWALIYGSPVPGYAAPRDTVRAAARMPTLLLTVLHDAALREAGSDGAGSDGAGSDGVTRPASSLAPDLEAALAPIRALVPPQIPDETLARGLTGWAWLLGAISSQLFGHRHNVITDDGAETFFLAEASSIAGFVGLPPGDASQ